MWFLSLTFVQSHIDTNLTVVPSTAIGLVVSAAWCDEMGKNSSGCYRETTEAEGKQVTNQGGQSYTLVQQLQ